jgi:dihydrolipoamide dehydrogenase
MYDVCIIGGGPGGYAAAIRSAQLGGKAVLVEAGELGGTCVNRGCIPTKVWGQAAELYQRLTAASDFGIQLDLRGVEFSKIVERKNGVAAEICMGMEALLQNNGVEVIKGQAEIINPMEIKVDQNTLTARNLIIATGSAPAMPTIAGADLVETLDQMLNWEALPSSVLVFGGEPWCVETANFLSVFGVKVTLATEDSRLLPKEDHDTGQRLKQSLQKQGLEILTKIQLNRVAKTENGLQATLTGNQERTLEIEKIICGRRRPNTTNLGIDTLGLACGRDGGIIVDKHLQSNINGIYAVGDVTGGWMLSHAASSMAITAAENTMGLQASYPFHLTPRALWTIPQIGAVGMSEAEAEKKGHDVEVGNFPYAINGLAMAANRVEGSVKIVIDTKYNDILGVHIVGENATELIGEAVLALQLECTADELAVCIRAHPTYSEAVVDASRDVLNWALYLPRQ